MKEAKEIAFGKNYINGPVNTRGNEYITNGDWLILESYAPKGLLQLKVKIKVKDKVKKSIVEDIFTNEKYAKQCIFKAYYERSNERNIAVYKYEIEIPKPSEIKRRKSKVKNINVFFQAKYIDYFKKRIIGFNIKGTSHVGIAYMYSIERVIGAIMPIDTEE